MPQQLATPIAIEALSTELAAVRCGVSADYIQQHYSGPYIQLGRLKRILSTDLFEWLDSLKASETIIDDPWAGVGDDAEESRISKRKPGKAA